MNRVYDCNRHVLLEKQQKVSSQYKLIYNIYSSAVVDLRENCTPVADQGQLGSCTGQSSVKGLLEYLLKKKAGISPSMSASYVYYYERCAESTIEIDAGAQVVDALYTLLKRGCATENTDPYFIRNFTAAPNLNAEAEAPHFKLSSASHLHSLLEIKNCITNLGPVVFGIDIFESFESQAVANSGMVPMPSRGEKLLGGHAVCAVGFDENKKVLIVRNSWGPDWGDKGYFYLPYNYIESYGSDFWTGSL